MLLSKKWSHCNNFTYFVTCNFVQQDHFDMLLVNLRMDSTFVKESMNIKWVSETGIVENMTAVVKDFKETRGLLVSSYMCHSDFVSYASSRMHFFIQVFCTLVFLYIFKLLAYIIDHVHCTVCLSVCLSLHCTRLTVSNLLCLSSISQHLKDSSRSNTIISATQVVMSCRKLYEIQTWVIAFSALTLLVGPQKGIWSVKNWVVGCWRGCL